MVCLLAWAADVVGGGDGGRSDDENYPNSIRHAQELDRKLASLNRLIQDLLLKLPPPDIPQCLPDIHAHSPAQRSFNYQETSMIERKKVQSFVKLKCLFARNSTKILEKLQEADLLRSKLKLEFDLPNYSHMFTP